MRRSDRPIPPHVLGAVIGATLTVAAASSTVGATAIDYREYMRWTGHSTALPDSGRAIVCNGSLVFIAADEAGLVIVDVSDIDAPEILTTLDLPGVSQATDVALAGDYAYLVQRFGGLVAVNISNPVAPFVTSVQILDGDARGIYATDTRLLVAMTRLAPDGRLITFDFAGSPTLPQEIGRVPTPRQAFRVQAPGRYAYVPDILCQEFMGCSGGLGVYQIVDGNPIEIGYRGTGPFDNIEIVGRYAHLVSSTNFGYRIYDVGAPTAIQLVGGISSVRPRDVSVDEGRALAFLTGDGLEIVDVSDVNSPVHLGRVHSPPSVVATRVQLLGKRALITDALSVSVIDIAHDGPAPLAGGIDTPGLAQDVATAGSVGVVADGYTLRTYDVSDPENPSFAGATKGGYTDVTARGSLAYGLAPGVLDVFDLTNSAAPIEIGSVPAPGSPLSIALTEDGNYVFASYVRAGATDGVLRVFDVRNPDAPVLVRGVDTGTTNEAVEVHISGTAAYVSLVQALEYDITDPENPAIRRVYHAPGEIVSFTTDDTHGYALSNAGDRSWLSVYERGSTVRIATLQIPGPGRAVSMIDDVVYVASGACGVNVIDVSKPAEPVYVGGVATAGDAQAIHPIGDVALLVADGTAGLQVASRQIGTTTVGVDPGHVPPITSRLGPVMPNPMRGAGRIPLTLDAERTVDLDVFDAAGRRVRVLLDDVRMPIGSHAISWDRMDDGGRILGAGTYFVRLTTGGTSESRRVVILR